MTREPGIMSVDVITGEFETLETIPDVLFPAIAVAAALEQQGQYTDVICCDPNDHGIGYLAFNPNTCSARDAYNAYLVYINGH